MLARIWVLVLSTNWEAIGAIRVERKRAKNARRPGFKTPMLLKDASSKF